MLERDGKAVPNSTPVRRDIRMTERGRSIVEDVAATLEVAIERRDRLDGRNAIVASFKARRDAKPATR